MNLDWLRSTARIAPILIAVGLTAAGVLAQTGRLDIPAKHPDVGSPSALAEGSARATDEALQGISGKLEPLERLLGDWDVGGPNQPEKPFRVVFEWKGNRSCMVYRSLQRQATAWVLLGTGMIYWDPATRAIRETTFEESTHLFQNGTWSPQEDRLVGEFVDYWEGATRRKAQYVIRFVDRDTMRMSGAGVRVQALAAGHGSSKRA